MDELDYSEDSGFGRELATDSEDRDDLDFTTDEGSSMFSRAVTPMSEHDPIGSMRRPLSKHAKPKTAKPSTAKKSAKPSKNDKPKKTKKDKKKKKPKKTKKNKKAKKNEAAEQESDHENFEQAESEQAESEKAQSEQEGIEEEKSEPDEYGDYDAEYADYYDEEADGFSYYDDEYGEMIERTLKEVQLEFNEEDGKTDLADDGEDAEGDE